MANSKQIYKIKTVKLGHHKRPLDTRVIAKWKSSLFSVTAIDEQPCIPNMCSDGWQCLSDQQVLESVSHDRKSDLTIAITEYALQDNFYMRLVSEKVAWRLASTLQYSFRKLYRG